MGIKILDNKAGKVLTLQVCSEHRDALLAVCGKVSGHTHIPENGDVHLVKIDPTNLSAVNSTNFRQIMAKLWDIKWAELKAAKAASKPF